MLLWLDQEPLSPSISQAFMIDCTYCKYSCFWSCLVPIISLSIHLVPQKRLLTLFYTTRFPSLVHLKKKKKKKIYYYSRLFASVRACSRVYSRVYSRLSPLMQEKSKKKKLLLFAPVRACSRLFASVRACSRRLHWPIPFDVLVLVSGVARWILSMLQNLRKKTC